MCLGQASAQIDEVLTLRGGHLNAKRLRVGFH